MEILLIALIVVGVVVAGLAAVAISVRRQGRLGIWVGTKLLSNQRVQKVAMNRIEQQLERDPGQFEDIAASHGVSRDQAQEALRAYQQMNPQQQRQLLARAQKMTGEDMPVSQEDLAEITASDLGVGPVVGSGYAGTTTKQRQRTRSKQKAARKARKRNR